LEYIHENYDGRVIARGYDKKFGKGRDWPAYSPGFSLRNFHLWGAIEDKVNKNRPNNISELKDKIKTVMGEIPQETCGAVCKNFERRLRFATNKGGGHIEGIIN